MILQFAEGQTLSVSFLPGHFPLRYEFAVRGQCFTVSRSRFLQALTTAGVDLTE